jgi:hypothetical protein
MVDHALLRPSIRSPYRRHPVTSITRSAVPTANPDATVTFPAGMLNSPRMKCDGGGWLRERAEPP